MTTVGSLCSGYGGLDLAAEAVFGARTVWHCEIEAAPSRVLRHRWPGVPNLGDLTAVDWAAVEPVDVMTAGYPCQPFSHAGQRKGTEDERHLWPHVAEAIRGVRPRYVVLENVAGHRSMGFDAVLGDLAALGYDTQWTSVRASDVGAPHGRERIFILAESSDTDGAGPQGREPAAGRHLPDRSATPDTERSGRRDGSSPEPIRAPVGGTAATGGRPDAAADTARDGRHERRTEPAGIIGGPDVAQRRGAVAPDTESERRPRPVEPRPNLVDHGPEPAHPGQAWGAYEPAIRRWERATRPAPAPAEPGPRGGHRLAPRFVEWMMGLPAGWVTDVPALTRNEQLRMLGNGVVPQQATAALCWLLDRIEAAA